MNIVVCLKQVPDTTVVKIDQKTGTLIREGVPSIINPEDKHALEAALCLKESHGGKITVISIVFLLLLLELIIHIEKLYVWGQMMQY